MALSALLNCSRTPPGVFELAPYRSPRCDVQPVAMSGATAIIKRVGGLTPVLTHPFSLPCEPSRVLCVLSASALLQTNKQQHILLPGWVQRAVSRPAGRPSTAARDKLARAGCGGGGLGIVEKGTKTHQKRGLKGTTHFFHTWPLLISACGISTKTESSS
ncbi:hypothetical protein GPALN_005714 [Globodera pallida]|nr:hypothetical protein GPALN_005714 [Globodera pallida]